MSILHSGRGIRFVNAHHNRMGSRDWCLCFCRVLGGEVLESWGEGDGWEDGFDLSAVFFDTCGEEDVGAELFGGFIDGHAGAVCGDFEEDAAGLAEVNGAEVVAVHDGGDVVAVGVERVEPGLLGGIIGGAEGDVMDLACAHAGALGVWGGEDIDGAGGGVAGGGVADAVLFARGFGVVEAPGEEVGGSGGVELGEGDAVKAADGILGRDFPMRPEIRVRDVRSFDEGEGHGVGIKEGDDGGAEARDGCDILDAEGDEAIFPVVGGTGGDGEGGFGDLSVAEFSGISGGPDEVSHEGAGASEAVAVVEVEGGGVIVVDGDLDEPQAEGLGVEGSVFLGVGGDGGDVVDAGDGGKGGGGWGEPSVFRGCWESLSGRRAGCPRYFLLHNANYSRYNDYYQGGVCKIGGVERGAVMI